MLGGLLIGVLMASLAGMRRPPQLARPFLGTGILGGFTTFSTYALDIRTMAAAGHPVLALGYAAATVAACLVAVGVGVALTRGVLRASTVPA
jgi:CrcB protein